MLRGKGRNRRERETKETEDREGEGGKEKGECLSKYRDSDQILKIFGLLR